MKYLEITFSLSSSDSSSKSTEKSAETHNAIASSDLADLLADQLANIRFESFSTSDNADASPWLVGYIQKKDFDETELQNCLKNFPFARNITYIVNEAEDKDWNEEWEKNCFEPLVIQNQCVIHASFHKNIPSAKYDILIDPKMAFGTGHHSTTSLMVGFILSSDMAGKSLLDMGCGTAILAILAAKKGASPVYAIDIDEWSFKNASENILLNHTDNIQTHCGCADNLHEFLQPDSLDFVLANINRNILLNDIHTYAQYIKQGGKLILSGFYVEDIDAIQQECLRNNLKLAETRTDNNWAAVLFQKS